MKDSKEDMPYCYGDIQQVFPKGEDGLRHVPAGCTVCYCKTECLRDALDSEAGLRVHEEKIKRHHSSGMLGFFSRWSQKKQLHKRRKKNS